MLLAAMSMVIRFGSMLPRFAALNVSHRAIIKGFSTRRGNCVFHFCLSWWAIGCFWVPGTKGLDGSWFRADEGFGLRLASALTCKQLEFVHLSGRQRSAFQRM